MIDSDAPFVQDRAPSPFDGAPVVCYRYRLPCHCEHCDPARHGAERAQAQARARRAIAQAMLDILPRELAEAWHKDGKVPEMVPVDGRYFIEKARWAPRDSAARYVWPALQALADALERALPTEPER